MKRLVWISLLLFAGCKVGPNYHKPETEMPLSFEEQRSANPISDEDLSIWWKQFEDPCLNLLIEEAVSGNYDWRIALEKIVETRMQYRIQSSYLWPEIDINAAANRSRFSDNLFASSSASNTTAAGASPADIVSGNFFSLPGTIQNFFQIGFDSIWELDFFGKFRRNKEAALDLWQASKESAQAVLISMISEIVRDYVSVRALQEEIRLIQEIIAVDERSVELAKILFEAGLDNGIQVQQAIAALETDKASLPLLETSLKQSILSIAALLGKKPEGFEARFEQRAPIPSGLQRVPAGLPSDLLRRRPDIKEAERRLAAATEKVGVAIADLFPHIALTGNTYGFESANINKWLLGASRYWNVGPILNWDFIDFGRTRSQVGLQNSIQRQAMLVYEQTVVYSLKDVEGALVAYFDEQKRLNDLEKKQEASLTSFTLTEDLFKAGLVGELQVLSAKKAWLQSENSVVQSNESLTGDLIGLYKALGGEWECCLSP